MLFLLYTTQHCIPHIFHISNSLEIRQGGKSQNGCNKKTKYVKISEKRTFLTHSYAHVRVRIRGKKCFSGNLMCFVFLLPPVEIPLFALLSTNSSVKIMKLGHLYRKMHCDPATLHGFNLSVLLENLKFSEGETSFF